MATRGNEIYVSASVSRWLAWLSKLDPENRTPPDAIADTMLREAILNKYPHIESITDKYWQSRKVADSEAIEQLKSGTKSEPISTPKED